MKNIHIIPTDKPSRLLRNGKELLLVEIPKSYTFYGNTASVNIYITSDEEIKEGDWFYNPRGKWIIKCNSNHLITVNLIEHKKIILTTDQDLIKDGVQAIDDEFLEWFVKNPSCEKVEIMKEKVDLSDLGHYETYYKYKIIIPKEEPKQETLEEAAEGYVNFQYPIAHPKRVAKKAFINGAKWQQERSYSEEEVLELLQDFANDLSDNVINIKFWFEQFKKK